jgi:hypothetical protein
MMTTLATMLTASASPLEKASVLIAHPLGLTIVCGLIVSQRRRFPLFLSSTEPSIASRSPQ